MKDPQPDPATVGFPAMPALPTNGATTPPAQRTRRRRRWPWWIGGAFLALFILGGIANALDPTWPAASSAQAPAAAFPTTATPSPVAPAVLVPAPSVGATAAPVPAAPVPVAATPGGVFNKDTWWDQHFRPESVAQCQADGEDQGIGVLRAWLLSGGGLACVQDSPDSPTWGGRITDADVYFPARTSERQAITAVAAMLSSDAAIAGTNDGVNPDYSQVSSGTCREISYVSAALGAAITASNPTWTDPTKVGVTLYSGHATSSDGSDKPYRATSVNEAIVTIGGPNRGTDGVVHC
jgi:hypothetical protein